MYKNIIYKLCKILEYKKIKKSIDRNHQKYYTQAIGKPIYQKQQIQLYGISQSKKEIRMVNKSKPVRGGQGDCSQIKD